MSKKPSLYQKIALILFGLFLTIIILEITLRIGSFTILSLQEYRNLASVKQKGSFRIMCLGESTTQGQYPPYLEDILNQRNIGIKFSVIDKGINGTNTAVIVSQLETNLDKYQPDMVITMMGINDRGRHMPYEANTASKTILAFHSLKVYKLTELIWLHIVTKLKEKGFYLQDINEQKGSSKKAIELNSSNEKAYIELGWLYRDQARFKEAEQSFKKAIELNPSNDAAYKELGRFYRHQGKLAEAEQLFKKAIELNSSNKSAYIGLVLSYKDQGKLAEAEQLFKKAIELNSSNDAAYQELGQLYRDQGKLAEAEQLFKKAIELNSSNTKAYIGLGWLYRDQGKLIEAEQIFKKTIKFNLKNDKTYRRLAVIYNEMGKNKLSEVYAKKANSIRDRYYFPETIDNYRKLKQIIDERNIKLVCVQYPTRNITLLKRVFREEANNIIFVDNNMIFKDAIRKEGYVAYFRDMFEGDFGHCTSEGNRLLAENIANTILKEVFNKK